MIMMTQIPRTTAPPPAAPIIITTPLSSPFLCAFLFPTPSSTAAELDGAVVVEEDCETEKNDCFNDCFNFASLQYYILFTFNGGTVQMLDTQRKDHLKF